MTVFVSRSQWGARPPRSQSTNIAPEGATAHYVGPTVWRGGPMDHNRCSSLVRGIQSFHMDSRGWSDIAYSSVVCPHDTVFEGRGAGVRTAANGTNSGNYRSYAVCALIGEGDPVTDGLKSGMLASAFKLGVPLRWSHSDWKSTSCPGNALRGWVAVGAPPPNKPVPPPPDIDWAKLRIFAARALRPTLGEQPTITKDSHPLRIALLQQTLNLIINRGLTVDGKWGPQTDAAVRDFQRFFGLTVDGIFGNESRFVACVILDSIGRGEL